MKVQAAEDHIGKIKLDHTRPIKSQIESALRQLIGSGLIEEGFRLPPTTELANYWGTYAPTVQASLEPLVRDGLLERFPSRGTFVRRAQQGLESVVLYFNFDLLGDVNSAYQNSLLRSLRTHLMESGIPLKLVSDTRPKAEQDTCPAELSEALSRPAGQGVVSLTASPEHLRWLKDLPVPVAYDGGGQPTTVGYDYSTLMRNTMRQARKRGVHTMGLISGYGKDRKDFFQYYVEEARDAGIDVRDEWIFGPQKGNQGSDRSHVGNGYRWFKDLWKASSQPEGLLVYPDMMAQGAVMAMAEQGVRSPNDLRLFLHKNENVPLFCPFSADALISREYEVAVGLVEQLKKACLGQPCEIIRKSYQLRTDYFPAIPR